MFTGIVQAVGKVESSQAQGAGVRLRVSVGKLDMHGVKIGDSIAIQGACMTVVEYGSDFFEVDVSAESLSKIANLETGHYINLEKSVRIGDTLDGHLVSGHVDGRGRVLNIRREAESHILEIFVPYGLAHFMAYKGSVAINGVSLTINEVTDCVSVDDSDIHDESLLQGTSISLNLIPHTFQNTTLQYLKAGDLVNIEVDTIARYVDRMICKLE